MSNDKNCAFPTIIYLTGYMGAGKSTVGKALATKLEYIFVDLDDEIVKSQGVSIKELFETHGEEYFRGIESNVLQKISDGKNIVISTGGGTPCFNDSIYFMNKMGKTIWLYVSPETVLERTMHTRHRPLLDKINDADKLRIVKEHMESREVYYSQADILIDAEQDIETIVVNIMDKLQK